MKSLKSKYQMAAQFCKLLPKIELHAHLNGSLSVPTIAKLVRLHKQSYPQEEVPSATEIFNDPKGFDDGYAIFKCAQALVDHPEAVKLAARSVLREFAEDNVKYVELRSTPRDCPGKMTKREYLLAIIEAIEDQSDIKAALLVSIDRRKSVEEADENVELALSLKKEFPTVVVGIDLSGDARVNQLQDYIGALQKAQDQDLKVSLHFAEVKNDKEIEFVLNHCSFKPDRVGHCTFIHHSTAVGMSESIWKKFCDWNIPSEICLTSNVKCRSVESYQSHHLPMWYKEKLPFAICTDDKGVFNCSSSEEYAQAMQLLELNQEEMLLLSKKSIEYIFADDNVKETLRSEF